VVGSYRAGDVSAYDQGYLFSAGTYTNINVPGGLWTLAAGINNNGQIVGAYLGPRLGARGFVLSHGIFNSIDFPGAAQTLAWDINNIGQIVGIYEDTRNQPLYPRLRRYSKLRPPLRFGKSSRVYDVALPRPCRVKW